MLWALEPTPYQPQPPRHASGKVADAVVVEGGDRQRAEDRAGDGVRADLFLAPDAGLARAAQDGDPAPSSLKSALSQVPGPSPSLNPGLPAPNGCCSSTGWTAAHLTCRFTVGTTSTFFSGRETLDSIRPGKPSENGLIEASNGCLPLAPLPGISSAPPIWPGADRAPWYRVTSPPDSGWQVHTSRRRRYHTTLGQTESWRLAPGAGSDAAVADGFARLSPPVTVRQHAGTRWSLVLLAHRSLP